jgi:hypothetical protein
MHLKQGILLFITQKDIYIKSNLFSNFKKKNIILFISIQLSTIIIQDWGSKKGQRILGLL